MYVIIRSTCDHPGRPFFSEIVETRDELVYRVNQIWTDGEHAGWTAYFIEQMLRDVETSDHMVGGTGWDGFLLIQKVNAEISISR